MKRHTPPAGLDIPAGYRLLCLAARGRGRHNDDTRRQAAALIADITDWQQFLTATRHHHLVAPVATLLNEPPLAGVPDRVHQRLHHLRRHQANRSLRQIATLQRLGDAFAAAGIRLLTLKGPPLSRLLFDDPTWRGHGDIDVLVEPARFGDAHTLLHRLGFHDTQPPHGPIPAPLRDVALRHANGEMVELHQRLTADPTLLPFTFENLWQGRRGVPGFSASTQTLAADLNALYLVVHGTDHGWTRLRWLADLLPVMADEDLRPRLVALAEQLALGPAVDRAFALCRALLEDQPHAILSPGQRRALTQHGRWFVADGGWVRACDHSDAPPWQRLRRIIRVHGMRYTMRRTWRGAWACLRADWLTPVDWHLFRLPPRWHWLYPLLRPLGWLLRRARKKHR